MKIVFITESAVKFTKGNRVVVKFDEDNWFLGNINKIRAGKLTISFDDGDEQEYSENSRAVKIVPDDIKKRKKALTDAQAKVVYSAKPVVSKEKPVVEKEKPQQPKAKFEVEVEDDEDDKPATRAKPKSENDTPIATPEPIQRKALFDEAHKNLSDLDVHAISESEYIASPILGIPYSTGRQGPTGSGVIIALGYSAGFKANIASVWTPHRDERMRFLGMKLKSYGESIESDLLSAIKPHISGKKLPYARFIEMRKQLAVSSKASSERRNEREEKSEENQQKHNLDYRAIDRKQVKIQWRGGSTSWMTVRGVKDGKVGINGSGHKLRWIPMSVVLDVRDNVNDNRY